jgi:DNA repair protein RadC
MKAKTPTNPKRQAEELPFFSVGEIKAVYLPATRPAAQIKCSQDAYKILLEVWEADQLEYKESLYGLFLNKANFVLGWRQLSTGGLSGTVADPKVVFQHALLSNACALIIAHNHPSGNLKPSEADHQMTKKIKGCGNSLDLPLLDHLIITNNGYYSFADEGKL